MLTFILVNILILKFRDVYPIQSRLSTRLLSFGIDWIAQSFQRFDFNQWMGIDLFICFSNVIIFSQWQWELNDIRFKL